MKGDDLRKRKIACNGARTTAVSSLRKINTDARSIVTAFIF